MFKVKLHSNSESGIHATDATLKMMGGRLVRDGDGNVEIDEDGNVFVSGSNEGYLQFACERQGYVAAVL